ncbi:DUF4806 domain-containing protein [Aphis craccivora]|uniref:DUF4806 domain-containing protein n=1 Tax=Aphis craccivora TaxID=307492 RepID=A0A6G0YRU8_APHCR|nr:DUF4806 domain-containing protein [Aphis craccivora]
MIGDKLILSSPLLESPIGKIMVENIDDSLEKELRRPISNEPIMPKFQAFVISSLTKLKFEISKHQLKIFDEKLKSNNDFKLNVMAKLSLFVGIENVGDSVRRLMSRMFSDELLQNYSLLGFKKKNRFSDFLVYRLILDVIRVKLKFSSTLDKKIDVPISIWLSLAKFCIKDKNNLNL